MIAVAALELVFLILEITFSRLSSRALVNDSAAIGERRSEVHLELSLNISEVCIILVLHLTVHISGVYSVLLSGPL